TRLLLADSAVAAVSRRVAPASIRVSLLYVFAPDMTTRPCVTATVPPDAVISPDRISPLPLVIWFTRSRFPFPPTVRLAETVAPKAELVVSAPLLLPLSRVSDPPDRARVNSEAFVLLKLICPTVMAVSIDTVPLKGLNVAVSPVAFGGPLGVQLRLF